MPYLGASWGVRSGVSGGRQGRDLLPFATSYIEERQYQITERQSMLVR